MKIVKNPSLFQHQYTFTVLRPKVHSTNQYSSKTVILIEVLAILSSKLEWFVLTLFPPEAL